MSRRDFHARVGQASAALVASSLGSGTAPGQVTAESLRPQALWGVSSGDVSLMDAVIWSRTDRPARMHVELFTDDAFRTPSLILPPVETLDVDDFTAKAFTGPLPPGEEMFYRVRFESLEHRGAFSEPLTGRLRVPPREPRAVRFLWSGDTAGQGWGIDPARGGMRMYETMRQRQPDFFIHSGDTIYADNPFAESLTLSDGTEWRNLVTPETAKVAETLTEFRGNFRYNHLDENFRRFHAQVPVFVQWDDHEVINNWYPDELLNDNRYTTRSAALLAARSRRAFLEYQPLRPHAAQQIYRSLKYGPDLELFFLDMRSERGPNSPNQQSELTAESAILGARQLAWLKQALAASTATWKVLCSDMPIGLIVRDGEHNFEAVANGDGPPLGRELEIASLLAFCQQQQVRNMVWLTADVHYAASHYYDPNAAQFQQFDPFWEFVSGPIHAGTFGPNELDNTFGPRVEFNAIPHGFPSGKGPADGYQFFGQVDLDRDSGALTVGHYNVAGEKLWERTLQPLPLVRR